MPDAKELIERLRGTYSTGPFGKRDFAPFIPAIQIEAADTIASLLRREEMLREALHPFGVAAARGYAVFQVVHYTRKEHPEHWRLTAPHIPAAVHHAQSQVSWNDWDRARLTLADLGRQALEDTDND